MIADGLPSMCSMMWPPGETGMGYIWSSPSGDRRALVLGELDRTLVIEALESLDHVVQVLTDAAQRLLQVVPLHVPAGLELLDGVAERRLAERCTDRLLQRVGPARGVLELLDDLFQLVAHLLQLIERQLHVRHEAPPAGLYFCVSLRSPWTRAARRPYERQVRRPMGSTPPAPGKHRHRARLRHCG